VIAFPQLVLGNLDRKRVDPSTIQIDIPTMDTEQAPVEFK
jgi:hypothetical protein